MKKASTIIILFTIMTTSFAQQTPKQIAAALKSYEQKIQRYDNGFDTVYIDIDEQIYLQRENPANLAIWHSCMAELLQQYYQQNQWRIMDRTPIEGSLPTDLNVWDLQTLVRQTLYHYQKSIENVELLSNIPIKDYKDLLDSLTSEAYRPTLYDFLAFRYLDYLSTSLRNMPVPSTPFDINNGKYWTENSVFTNMLISSPDDLSFSYLTLKTMQTLTKLHLNDADPRALIDVTIRRFNYLSEHSTLENASELQLKALEQMEKQYQGKGYEMIAYAMGEYYSNRADKYSENLHPEYKDDYIEAVEWFDKTIDAAPESIEANNAQVAIRGIKSSRITLSHNDIYPEQPSLLNFSFKNSEVINLRVIPMTGIEYYALQKLTPTAQYSQLIQKKFVLEKKIPLPAVRNYREKQGHYLLPALKEGSYVIFATNGEFNTNNKKEYTKIFVHVTQALLTYRENDTHYEFLATDKSSGHPLQGVDVIVATYKNSWGKDLDRKDKLTTDKDGKCEVDIPCGKEGNRIEIAAYWKNNEPIFETQDYKYNYYSYKDKDSALNRRVHLFTDRNIYRPGQTVYYKGILVEELQKYRPTNSTEAVRTVSDEQIDISFRDANRQLVEKTAHVTNEYGSFSGSFVIPTSGMTGVFHLETANGSCTFRVEEYKRPTFEIAIDQPKEEYKLEQEVAVMGNVKAFAGYGIDGATVKYHVVRKASFPWWRWWWYSPSSAPAEIANGETTTDADGNFSLSFIAQPDLECQRFNPLYNYEVSVNVTDINGETHAAKTNICISKIGLQIVADFPDEISINDKNEFPVKVTNLSNQAQPSTLHYKIELLETPSDFRYECPSHDYFLSDSTEMLNALPYLDINNTRRPEEWKMAKIIQQGDFHSDGKNNFSIANLNHYAEGTYKITFTTTDKDNNEVVAEHYVTIFNPESKHCVAYKPIWLYQNPDNVVEVGNTVQITLGTYLKNAEVLFEIVSNDKLLESRWITLNQGKTTINYPLSEKELGQLIFHAFVVQNGRTYSDDLGLYVPYSHQKIDFDFITFRDKTQPGSQEQYQIRLKNHLGEKVAAELLCAMYDASLDALAGINSFSKFIFVHNKSSYRYSFQYGPSNFSQAYAYQLSKESFGNYKERLYPALNCFFGSRYGYRTTYGRRPMMAKAAEEQEEVVLNVVEDNISVNSAIDFSSDFMEESVDFETGESAVKERAAETPAPTNAPEEPVAVRTNFAETAFFYPHLKTDAEGNVLVSFTMPESLTRWHLQGFAHNNDLMSGYFEKFVTTSKKLMVVPNAPRFLREGDTLVFSAKVVNTDSVMQCGNVTLSFRNAMDDTPLNLIQDANVMSFEVKPGESQEVHFTVVVPRDLSAVTYRIVATNLESPAFSDGEEATLPVLTNRILVTEAMQLHISGKGSKAFTFDRLKNSFAASNSTLSTQSLTLEFTPNPIWYAIQAMPYLMEYPYECNEQVFSRYYANALAANLVNSHPRIKTVFDEWLNSTPDAFCSQLEKNQELKSILLEETPWVMDAQRESARKQNIALLFDLQRMAREGKDACRKLQDRQNGDGGWSWFNGGQSSTYITEHILAGLGHLQVLNVPTDFNNSTQRKAISYIDQQMYDYYQRYQRKDKVSGWGDIHYLYARSFFLKQAVPAKCKEAYSYNYNNIKKDWKKQSIYMQGMIALICYRNGDTQLAKEIVGHIKSMAQHNEEMGMFWKKSGYGYFWYEAPIERQALLIEAFHTITKDEKSVEEMQLWLLKQKQTQSWPTTKSTTEAIYALLLNNSQLENANSVQLTLGDWQYTEGDGSEQTEAGTGYIKKSWPGTEVKADMATLKIDKSSSGPAWGGLYWQYLENLDKVDHSQDVEMNIRKQLYKVELNERGEVLTEITEQSPIKVGDRVRVRVEIRTDRDMEYVHLKDMRAACFEPTNVLSGYKHQDGLWYYESTRDAATNFFIDYLPKGTYVFEYTLVATMAGTYSNGLTTMQCMYAPEFTSHSEGIRVRVEK